MAMDEPMSRQIDYQTPRRIPLSSGREAWQWIWIAIVMMFAIFALISSRSGLGKPPQVSWHYQSQDHLRQIGQSISHYCDTHHGDFPAPFATLLDAESMSAAQFVSLLTNDTPAPGAAPHEASRTLLTGGHCSYIYLGRGLNASAVGPDDIIAVEPPHSLYKTPSVLFGDGHVEAYGPAAWTWLANQLAGRPVASTQPIRFPLGM